MTRNRIAMRTLFVMAAGLAGAAAKPAAATDTPSTLPPGTTVETATSCTTMTVEGLLRWYKQYLQYRKMGKARGTPTQIPIMDGDLNRQALDQQAAMHQIGALAAQATSTGAGIKVAVLDGGFDLRHEIFEGHLDGHRWDAMDFDDDPQDLGNDADDDFDGVEDRIVGHGTFVSSVVLGVAPGATIMPIRVLDDEGWGTEMSVTLGVLDAIAAGADVINMSLVVPDASFLLQGALESAAAAGVIVCGAGGNGPTEWNMDPVLGPRVLALGAVDGADVRCTWSATGWFVDTYAPGSMVIGALGGDVEDSYAWWSGTSFSTPMAAGGAAIMLGVEPWLMPEEIVLRYKATDAPAYDVQPVDRGRIDIEAALGSGE